ncbi:MAG: DUF4373 domain-containing protein [Ruminococcaceae bacterium]|nr:DUF4373 domain-containing protein [Oscillospiraceae bacterium]
MARPLKDGVGYFPKDTDFYNDDKVKILRGEFGAKGMYLLDYLLCDLYGKNGYYTKWDKNKCFLVSDGAGCGCVPSFVAEFILGCVRCGIFDETVFNLFKVLTSAGIQRRFVRMLNSRENFTFYEEYFLLDINNEKDVPKSILNKIAFKKVSDKENPLKIKENPEKSIDNAQNKIDENKVNENKVDDVMKAYEENIEKASSATKTKLTLWKNSVSEELIILAIEEAVSQNKKSYAYINAILESWKEQGFKNIDDVKKHQENYKRKNKKGLNNYSENRSLSDFEKQMLERRINGN